jgi:hypothetical protein
VAASCGDHGCARRYSTDFRPAETTRVVKNTLYIVNSEIVLQNNEHTGATPGAPAKGIPGSSLLTLSSRGRGNSRSPHLPTPMVPSVERG